MKIKGEGGKWANGSSEGLGDRARKGGVVAVVDRAV